MKTKRLEAMDLVALRIDAINAKGTPRQAKAEKLSDYAVKQWKEDFNNRGKCPHCGKRIQP